MNAEESDLYDFAPEMPVPPAQVKPVKTTPIQYRSAAPVSERKADPETIKNFYMPLWLLVGGVAIELISVGFIHYAGVELAALHVGINIIIGTAIMLAGMLVAVKFRGINLGNFGTAIFKLSAIAIAPTAVVDLLGPLIWIIPFGGLIVYFVLYFALMGALFDLDQSDTWYFVSVIFVIQIALYFAIIAVGMHFN